MRMYTTNNFDIPSQSVGQSVFWFSEEDSCIFYEAEEGDGDGGGSVDGGLFACLRIAKGTWA